MNTTKTADHVLRILFAGEQTLGLVVVLVLVVLCGAIEKKRTKPIFRRVALLHLFILTSIWCFGIGNYIQRVPPTEYSSDVLFLRYIAFALVFSSLLVVFEYRSAVTGFSLIGALTGHYLLMYLAIASGNYIYACGSSASTAHRPFLELSSDRHLQLAATYGIDLAGGLLLFFLVGQLAVWLVSQRPATENRNHNHESQQLAGCTHDGEALKFPLFR